MSHKARRCLLGFLEVFDSFSKLLPFVGVEISAYCLFFQPSFRAAVHVARADHGRKTDCCTSGPVIIPS